MAINPFVNGCNVDFKSKKMMCYVREEDNIFFLQVQTNLISI